jgi:hypothetical protein
MGLLQGFLLPLLVWGISVALGYSDQQFSDGPYRGILLALALYCAGPVIALLQWAVILPWREYQPDKAAPYVRGLMIGGGLGAGVCCLAPGLMCIYNVGI